MDGPHDVSGVWYGRYFAASAGVDENSFIARLEESGGEVSGAITEPDTTGVDQVRRAFVDGERSGTALSFVKQYDPAGALAHSVSYAGTLNDDGTEVTGTWRFSGYHGSFVMNREKFTLDELEEESAIEEPITIVMDEPIERR